MAAAAILDYEKLLPFLYYLTDRHKNLWKQRDLDLEHIDDVRNAKFGKFKMAIAANLDFKKLLPFHYSLTDHHHIY